MAAKLPSVIRINPIIRTQHRGSDSDRITRQQRRRVPTCMSLRRTSSGMGIPVTCHRRSPSVAIKRHDVIVTSISHVIIIDYKPWRCDVRQLQSRRPKLRDAEHEINDSLSRDETTWLIHSSENSVKSFRWKKNTTQSTKESGTKD
jgi:hypothetical protein